jgi:hypothetical protein
MKIVSCTIVFFLGGFLYLFVNTGYSLDIHEDIMQVGCLVCHEKLPFAGYRISFTEKVNDACIECHHDHSYFSHPIELAPSMPIPIDMPLNKNGEIACITCHKFHEGFIVREGAHRSFLLRRTTTGKLFCYSCHKSPQELK